MTDIDQIASDLRAEAAIDFVELPLITGAVEFELGIKDPQQIRDHTLKIIRRLMALDVYPGEYDFADRMLFWRGDPEQLLTRIETEWLPHGWKPCLDDSSHWLGLRLER